MWSVSYWGIGPPVSGSRRFGLAHSAVSRAQSSWLPGVTNSSNPTPGAGLLDDLEVPLAGVARPQPEVTHVQDRRDARGADGLDAAGRPGQVAVPIACEHDLDHEGDRSGPSPGAANRFLAASTWGALGTHNNEKRRLTLEDVERRFRRSAAVFGDY